MHTADLPKLSLGPSPSGTCSRALQNLTPGAQMAFQDEIWLVEEIGPDPTSPGLLRVEGSVTASPRPVAIGQRRQGSGSPRARVDVYEALDGHLPVCGHCGGLWPCQWLQIDEQTSKCLACAVRYEVPGVCPTCQEPVTGQQLRQTWSVNLYALEGPVVFHLRVRCLREAEVHDRAYRLRAILHVWVCEVRGVAGAV